MILDEEANEHTKTDYYLAQIALETRRSYVKKPTRYKLKDFLFSFTRRFKPKKRSLERSDEEDTPKARIEHSKSMWCSILGVTRTPKKKA